MTPTEELAEVVVQSARRVFEDLRGGRGVATYFSAMEFQLKEELSTQLQVKPRIDIMYRGHVMRCVVPDFIISGNGPYGVILRISVSGYDKWADAIDCSHQLGLPAYSIEFGTNELRVIRQC